MLGPQDIKTDYARGDSKTFTTQLNQDHEIIKAAILGGVGGAGTTGAGRLTGYAFEVGRAVPATPEDLLIYIPNATYMIDSQPVIIDEPGGFAIVPAPANMDPGQYGYLSEVEGGGVTILPEHWSETLLDELEGVYPCIGRVLTDADKVVSIDYRRADEILLPANLMNHIKRLQALIDALSSGGGGDGEGGGIDTIGRGDIIPWDAEAADVFIKPKVLSLLDDLRVEFDAKLATGQTRPMQTDNDHFVESLMRIYATVVRLAPEATDLVEAAGVFVGFAGHSLSGDFEDPGVNGTTNHLKYTTMSVDTLGRQLRPN